MEYLFWEAGETLERVFWWNAPLIEIPVRDELEGGSIGRRSGKIDNLGAAHIVLT